MHVSCDAGDSVRQGSYVGETAYTCTSSGSYVASASQEIEISNTFACHPVSCGTECGSSNRSSIRQCPRFAGFALGSTMIATCSNTTVYVGVIIFALCGPVGVSVGFEAARFLSATGVGLFMAVASGTFLFCAQAPWTIRLPRRSRCESCCRQAGKNDPAVLDASISEQQCCMEIGTVSKEHVLTALESSVAREVHGHRRCQPDDFNGYGYFYVSLNCTGLGFQANIVEEYGLLSALQHIFAGLKRTRDQKLSSGLMSGQLNLAITGLMLLTFMTIHLLHALRLPRWPRGFLQVSAFRTVYFLPESSMRKWMSGHR